MHNMYSSSNLSLMTSFSFNDYCYFLNERYRSSFCTCCSSIPINSSRLVHINPSFLCGLRQSNLIQLAPSRRLILCGRQYLSSIYDVSRSFCEKNCCIEERISGRVRENECNEACCVRKRISARVSEKNDKRRYNCGVFEEKCEARRGGMIGDAEAMLSLLTEDVNEECFDVRGRKRENVAKERVKSRMNDVGSGLERDWKDEWVNEECFDVRGRKGGLSKRGNAVRRESVTKERIKNRINSVGSGLDRDWKDEWVNEECFDVRRRKGGSSKSGKVVRRENVAEERIKSRMDSVGSGLERDWKDEWEWRCVQSKEEGYRGSEEAEALQIEKDGGLRRRESTGSSFYSLDSGGFESDTDIDVKHEVFVGESSVIDEKESRKNGGIVINEEAGVDTRRYREERDEYLQSDRREKMGVGSAVPWEKKLIEESAKESKSRKDSVIGRSRLPHPNESKSVKASSLKKKSNYQEELSTSAANFHDESRSHIGMENQHSRYSNSGVKYDEATEIRGDGFGTASSSRSRLSGREENAALVGNLVQEASVDYSKACGQITQEERLQSSSHQHAERSDVRHRKEWTLASDRKPLRLENEEESSTSTQTKVMNENEQHGQTILVGTGEVDSSRRSQNRNENIATGERYLQRASRSQRESETIMNISEKESTLLISSQEARGEIPESGGLIRKTKSRRAPQHLMGTSAVYPSETERVTGARMAAEQRICHEQSHLASEKHKQIEKIVLQTEIRTKVHEPFQRANFSGSSSGEAMVTPPSVALISHSGEQEIGEKEDKRDRPMMSPSSQLMEREPVYVKPAITFVRQDSGTISEGGSGRVYVHPSSRTSPLDEVDSSGQSRSHDRPSHQISHEDLLGSVERMEMSSAQFVSEFVEKVRHEAPTSEEQIEKKFPETESVHRGEKHLQRGPSKSDSQSMLLKRQKSSRSSGGSGTKGPSDETWDVKDQSAPGAVETEAPVSTLISKEADMKRTGKSLWSTITGIFQLRWGSRTETQKSPVKSGGPSSLNESASGETWFSGNEPDETNSDNMKRERTSVPSSGDQPLIRRSSTQSSTDKVRYNEVGASSSSNVLESATPSGDASMVTNIDWGVEQQIAPVIPSVDSSGTSSRLFRRAHTIQEIPGEGEANPIQARTPTDDISEEGERVVLRSSTGERMEHNNDSKMIGTSGSEEKVGDLKRRKFQRSKQVPQERFEVWEEAYRRRNEERKIDEMFMKEALVEAKKAADSWEVPVGAVLVQNGKIIARGYNLVEELRDSTAHAEMICIREASNVLQSWRLSETTLYVTLEPCPMCAGAILQARIGTLVWGAPNKLLGADGSWIRLFPDRGEGDQGPESTEKPPAPIHPFHPNMTIRRGVMEEECAEMMQQFFQLRRRREKKTEPEGQPSCLPVPHHPSKLFHKMHGMFHLMFCL